MLKKPGQTKNLVHYFSTILGFATDKGIKEKTENNKARRLEY